MNKEELNAEIIAPMKTPDRLQEFTDLASPEGNWSQINKKFPFPAAPARQKFFYPICFDPVRLIFDKFSSHDLETPLLCPHCKIELVCKSWFVGFTNEVTLEERR